MSRPDRNHTVVTPKLVELNECSDLTRHGGAICMAGSTDCCLTPAKTALCTNLQSDPANCGACGHTCASGQTCNAGVCDTAGGCTGPSCSTGITLDAPQLPTDRSGKVTLTWKLPAAPAGGAYVSYELRCDPAALSSTVSADQKQAWWDAARVVTLPAGLTPPTATVQLDFRVGDNNNCVLRALDAAKQGTTLTASTNIQVKFREARYAPSTSASQYAGFDFAPVGDVNGDGSPDLLVGGGGEAYLVFGNSNLPNNNSTPATPDVTFVSRSNDPYGFGADVASIGDWNGDGLNDFAIADSIYNGGQGRVLVYFGRTSGGWGNNTRISVGESCVADVCLIGAAGSQFGFAVAGVGNFDNAGGTELAIGANTYNGTVGRLYVLRYNNYATGNAPAAGSFYNVSLNVDSQTDGWILDGVAGTGSPASRQMGASVAGIVTYDSSPGADLVVTAPGSGADAVNGRLFLVSGSTTQASGLTAIPGTNVRQLDQGSPESFAGIVYALGNVVDIASANKPGTIDIGVFNYLDTGFYVYPGDTDFAPESKIFVNGEAQDFGQTVGTGATFGDLDGDGKSEVCAAGSTDPLTNSSGGVPYLWYDDVFARKLGGTSSNLLFTRQGSPLQVQAQSASTRRPVEFIGDLNGDGKRDLAVGSPGSNGNRGEFTVLY